ncbi:hypothetical protein [Streptomyces canus]|uniref:hypothetical protein n=1 Tax=Streptomyces canus TaxID=58343 RepID=UPI00278A7590|nr:hypothetical protein [Streptomyces canus]MDQ0758677.1 ribosomal protein S27AE [Streptomyces canus]
MSPELPPFSGDEPTCPKCGNEGACTFYRAKGEPSPGQVAMASTLPERLERRCTRCDYGWDEATVQQEAP